MHALALCCSHSDLHGREESVPARADTVDGADEDGESGSGTLWTSASHSEGGHQCAIELHLPPTPGMFLSLCAAVKKLCTTLKQRKYFGKIQDCIIAFEAHRQHAQML